MKHNLPSPETTPTPPAPTTDPILVIYERARRDGLIQPGDDIAFEGNRVVVKRSHSGHLT